MENKIIIAETERLILRRYKKEDVQDLFDYLSDKEVVRYEPYKQCHLDKFLPNNDLDCVRTPNFKQVSLWFCYTKITNTKLQEQEKPQNIGFI